jgi:hypothetical protein
MHRNSINNQEELERRIVYGLSCEWEAALWILDPPYRKCMRRPLFCLGDFNGKLGTWTAEKREITISRNLVLNHPWDSVREVLLHEMAHQFREEVLGIRNEPPHGPNFLRACALLRANPKASSSYPTLDERVLRDPSDNRDRLMTKIRKLMALAESCNRHEAEAAMAKAHELIARYNMELVSRRDSGGPDDNGFCSIFLGRPALRHTVDNYHIAHLLQDFYFVKGIWVSAFVIEKLKMGRVLEISGSPENIRIAAYVHDCINRYIRFQWLEYSNGRRYSTRQRNDFAIGIMAGFRSKLENSVQAVETRTGTTALIELQDPLLERYIRIRYPHLVGFRRGAQSMDRQVRRDGERVGRKLVIARGITERRNAGLRLLLNR